MVKGISKRFLVGVLAVFTLGLGGLAVFVGFQLSQQDQAPEDTAAQSRCAVEQLGGVDFGRINVNGEIQIS